MSRLYLCEHRTREGRFGTIAIDASTWAEAEDIARRVIVADASPLTVSGYQDGDWDDTMPAHVDHAEAGRFVAAVMARVDEIVGAR